MKNTFKLHLHRCQVNLVDLRTGEERDDYIVVECPTPALSLMLCQTLKDLGYCLNGFKSDSKFPGGVEVKIDLNTEYEKATDQRQ